MFDSIQRLEADEPRPIFDCGDCDLNEFFHTDSINYAQELLAVTYITYDGTEPVGYFSVFNDAIRFEDIPKSSFKRMQKVIPHEKRYKNIPVVKIGRFAVCASEQGKQTGSAIMGFLKYWFKINNKTGCRFIVVDAYNNDRTINFYQKNGFSFITPNDETETTRIMRFDLMEFNEA